MKKILLISAVLAMMFFVVSCDSNLKFNNPYDPNNREIGDDSKITGELNGECYKNKTCDEGLVCEEERNLCVQDNGTSEDPDENTDHDTYADDSDSSTDADADEDTDDDSDNPGKTTAEACAEIYQCAAQCGDSSCMEECQNSGTPEAQETFTTMYNCWMDNCQNAQSTGEFTNCIAKNCCYETEACGFFGPSCETYSSPYANPYGTAQINIASNYIVSEADNPDVTKIEMGSFITGNIGHSPIANLYTEQSYYYSMLYTTEQGETFIRTIQFFTNENGVEVFNPFVIALTNISATAGSNHYGIVGSYNPTGLIMIVDADITDNDLDISCYHAFSEGELNIQNIVPSAGSEGALAVNGTIDLYSPKNYAYSLGDISTQLDVPVCNPQ